MDEDDDTQVYKDDGDALTIAYQSGYYDGKKAAQPEQEPVAYTLNCVCGAVWDIKADGSEEMAHTPDTTPPLRPWVGLTDEERNYIWNTVGNSDSHGDVDGRSGRDVMSAIEAKLKEKNK